MRGYVRYALIFLAACAGDSSRDECGDEASCAFPPPDTNCSLDKQVAKLISTQSIDCGTVMAKGTRAEYDRARQCIADALVRGDAFHAIKWEQGIDSSPATGFVSLGGGQPVMLLSYDSDPTGGSGAGARVTKRSCNTLTNNDGNPTCEDEYRYQLCFVCVEAVPSVEAVCRGPRTRP